MQSVLWDPFEEYPPARVKTKMQVLIVVIRGFLYAIFGMFKHPQPFEGGLRTSPQFLVTPHLPGGIEAPPCGPSAQKAGLHCC